MIYDTRNLCGESPSTTFVRLLMKEFAFLTPPFAMESRLPGYLSLRKRSSRSPGSLINSV
jgi:hypothetical protein